MAKSLKYCDFFTRSKWTIIHKVKGKKTLCQIELKNVINSYKSYPVKYFSFNNGRADRKCRRCWGNN